MAPEKAAAPRGWNFCAGPAALPGEVLREAQKGLQDWDGRGISLVEMSHRGHEVGKMFAQAEEDLRALLDIPGEYAVLFLQGGAAGQFAAAPLNLARGGRVAYAATGLWSERAIAEARRFAEVSVVADAAPDYLHIPPYDTWRIPDDAAYCHITLNETINGVEFQQLPEGKAPLVTDASSTLLSRPLEVRRFGLIYAGAQKNIGLAGLTLVIVRRELLRHAAQHTPSMLDYTLQAEQRSLYNTPPVFACYVAALMFRWIKDQGGLPEMERRNRRKAECLYRAIDELDLYHNKVAVECRSLMNVPFQLADTQLEKAFLEEARQCGLHNLRGHRKVGGMRASLYNSISEEGVEALAEFLRDFAARNG